MSKIASNSQTHLSLFINAVKISNRFLLPNALKNPNKEFLGNRPSSILIFDRLDPYNFGRLIAYYEHKIVFQGFIWNINSFDQEGVQLGKSLASKMMNLFSKKDIFPLGQAFLDNL